MAALIVLAALQNTGGAFALKLAFVAPPRHGPAWQTLRIAFN